MHGFCYFLSSVVGMFKWVIHLNNTRIEAFYAFGIVEYQYIYNIIFIKTMQKVIMDFENPTKWGNPFKHTTYYQQKSDYSVFKNFLKAHLFAF